MFSDTNCTNVLLGQSPNTIELKNKNKQMIANQLISFCTAKEAINKMKRQPEGWEKMFANEVTEGTNLKNIKTTHTTQQQQIKNGQKT